MIGFLLSLLILFGPFFVPIPPSEKTVSVEQLADRDSRFAEVRGVKLHYKATGQGDPALVLLHGFLASLFSWREVMDPLGRERRVIAFDRPAFGLTERPMPGEWQGENPYSARAEAAFTVGLMDKLGIKKAVLVGNSAGGTTAMLTALLYPERVKALVLVDAAIYYTGPRVGWLRPLLRTPQMRRLGQVFVRHFVNRAKEAGRAAFRDPGKLTPEVWAGHTKPLQAENWDRALWEFLLAREPLNLEAMLRHVKVPVLVITGAQDQIIPPSASRRLARELPSAELVVIEDCGHVPQEERPEEFIAAVKKFLKKIENE